MKKASDIRNGNIGGLFGRLGGLVGPSWGPSGEKLGPGGRVKGPSWEPLWGPWGRLATKWHLEAVSGVLLGSPGAPKSHFGPLKSCPGTAQGRSQAPKSSFYDGFAHVGFPTPEPPEILRKRSGAPPEASGSAIFGQNRHFTRVSARSRLLTVSLPNAFF